MEPFSCSSQLALVITQTFSNILKLWEPNPNSNLGFQAHQLLTYEYKRL